MAIGECQEIHSSVANEVLDVLGSGRLSEYGCSSAKRPPKHTHTLEIQRFKLL